MTWHLASAAAWTLIGIVAVVFDLDAAYVMGAFILARLELLAGARA